MKSWIARHRKALRRAWKTELRAREIEWQDFCREMYSIWQSQHRGARS